MSEASKKGRDLEKFIAKTLRSKLGAKVFRDPRSGAGDTTRTDIKDFGSALRWAIEAKNQKTIKLKDWWRQTASNTPGHQQPCLIINVEQDHDRDEVLAVVRFEDLVNLEAEVKQLQAQLDDLRAPIVQDVPSPVAVDSPLKTVTASLKAQGAPVCANDHLVDDNGYCLARGCPYSRGYHVKRNKKA